MSRKFWVLLLALVFAATAIAGCGAQPVKTAPRLLEPSAPSPATPASKETKYPVTVKDAAGRDVTIPTEPKRVISVLPSNTELTFALGKGSVLVGRSDFDDYPAEVKNIESIGGILKPNFEKYVALRPDLILFSGGSETVRNQLVNDYKLNVYVVDPKNFAQLYDGIAALGVVLNAQEKATAVIEQMQKTVREVTEKTLKASSSPKVFYQVWDDPLMTAGTSTFVDDLIRLAGGTNAAGDVKGWANYSLEKLQGNDPDLLIADGEQAVAKLKANKGWQGLQAVKNGKVFAAPDQSLITRPGPRLVEGLKWFAQTIHPELFK